MKEEIYKAIDISDSIDDLVFNLKKNKIQTKIGWGISFIDNQGVRKKGSDINRNLH